MLTRARLWTLPSQPPRLVGAAVSAETARWCGGWADGLVTINQPRATLERVTTLSARVARGAADLPAGPSQLGEQRGGGAPDCARPVADQRLRPAALLGSGDGRAVRPRRRPRAPGGHATGGASCRRRRPTRRVAGGAPRAWIRTDSPAPCRPGPAPVHPCVRRARLAGTDRVKTRRPATSGGRTPSSTASTSRPSWILTTTAVAICQGSANAWTT